MGLCVVFGSKHREKSFGASCICGGWPEESVPAGKLNPCKNIRTESETITSEKQGSSEWGGEVHKGDFTPYAKGCPFLPEAKPTGLVEAMCVRVSRACHSSPRGIGVTRPDQMWITMTHYDSLWLIWLTMTQMTHDSLWLIWLMTIYDSLWLMLLTMTHGTH